MHDRPAAPAANHSQPPDDVLIAALVRDVAARWVAPIARPGRPTWRDRVGARATWNHGRPVGRRLAAAVAIALVATVGLGVVAAWLASPRSGLPAIGAASSAPSSPPSPSVAASAPAATVPVTLNDERVAGWSSTGLTVLDLGSGTATPPGALARTPGSTVVRLADGRYLCACVGHGTSPAGTGPTTETVTLVLRTVEGDGTITSRNVDGLAHSGIRDASIDPAWFVVSASTAFDPGRNLVYLGWSARVDHRWQRGIDVVDVGTARVLQAFALPEIDDTQGAVGVFAWEPIVRVAPDRRHAVVALTTVIASGTDSQTWRQPMALDADGTIAGPSGPADAIAVACPAVIEGWASADRYFALCSPGSTLHLFDASGGRVTTVPVASPASPDEGPANVLALGGRLYHWDPVGRTLTVVDPEAGMILFSGAAAPISRTADPVADLLAGVSRWVAPPAAAKSVLTSTLVATPDGARVYALGVTGPATGRGSAGIDVFDTAKLAFVAHWKPTADWFSMAMSADGFTLYASSLGGLDPTGALDPSVPSSLTALDAISGDVKLTVGRSHDPLDLALEASY